MPKILYIDNGSMELARWWSFIKEGQGEVNSSAGDIINAGGINSTRTISDMAKSGIDLELRFLIALWGDGNRSKSLRLI